MMILMFRWFHLNFYKIKHLKNHLRNMKYHPSKPILMESSKHIINIINNLQLKSIQKSLYLKKMRQRILRKKKLFHLLMLHNSILSQPSKRISLKSWSIILIRLLKHQLKKIKIQFYQHCLRKEWNLKLQ